MNELVGLVLATCGGTAALVGTWRGYAVAREAIAPLAHDGDPTRSAIEAGRPLPMRPRVRLAVRRVGVAIGWLVVAMYGLYQLSYAGGIGA